MANYLTMVLVKFRDRWDDGTDVSGFAVMTRQEHAAWKRGLVEGDLFPTGELEIGAGPSVSYDTADEYLKRVECRSISQEDADVLARCFGGRRWGRFVDAGVR